MNDQEALIRQAIAAEAADAVDSRVVLAELQKKRRKPLGMMLGITALTVAAAAAAVIIPTTIKQTNAESGNAPDGPQNVLFMHIDDRGRVRYFTDYRNADDVRHGDFTIQDPEKLLRAVGELTGVRPDNYAAMDYATLGRFATIVGGAEVCMKPWPGADSWKPVLPAGKHTISGDQAKTYFEQPGLLREDGTPRNTRNRAFFTGLAAKVNGGSHAELAREAARSVKVDEGWDVLAFAQRF